ncbi:hypothetical protein [Arthrobacter sp. YAF16]|uniref:hypothetical protein n=1 Tax=Arthrobacter sp. YAF16 TaxID=3233076 RepID=UPI003F8F55FC
MFFAFPCGPDKLHLQREALLREAADDVVGTVQFCPEYDVVPVSALDGALAAGRCPPGRR